MKNIFFKRVFAKRKLLNVLINQTNSIKVISTNNKSLYSVEAFEFSTDDKSKDNNPFGHKNKPIKTTSHDTPEGVKSDKDFKDELANVDKSVETIKKTQEAIKSLKSGKTGPINNNKSLDKDKDSNDKVERDKLEKIKIANENAVKLKLENERLEKATKLNEEKLEKERIIKLLEKEKNEKEMLEKKMKEEKIKEEIELKQKQLEAAKANEKEHLRLKAEKENAEKAAKEKLKLEKEEQDKAIKKELEQKIKLEKEAKEALELKNKLEKEKLELKIIAEKDFKEKEAKDKIKSELEQKAKLEKEELEKKAKLEKDELEKKAKLEKEAKNKKDKELLEQKIKFEKEAQEKKEKQQALEQKLKLENEAQQKQHKEALEQKLKLEKEAQQKKEKEALEHKIKLEKQAQEKELKEKTEKEKQEKIKLAKEKSDKEKAEKEKIESTAKSKEKQNQNQNQNKDKDKVKAETPQAKAQATTTQPPAKGNKPNNNKNEKAVESKYKIDFHTKTPNKEIMEKLISNMLKEDGITPEQAEKFKTKVREPTYGYRYESVIRANDPEYVDKVAKNWLDLEAFHRATLKYQKLMRYQFEQRREAFDERYKLVKDMDRPLMIGEEPSKRIKDNVKWTPHQKESYPNTEADMIGKRQPRIELNYNYNFEENTTFTRVYEEAKKLDTKNVDQRNKLLAYLKQNKTKTDDRLIYRELNKLSSDVDKYYIPDGNYDFTNYSLPLNRKDKKPIIPKHSSDVTNYEIWRSFDKKPSFFRSYNQGYKKITISPAKLRKRFYEPNDYVNSDISGCYYFEDNNLDVFMLYEFRQTTMSYGENYPDEMLIKQEQLRIYPKRRYVKLPSRIEFWDSEEPKEFRIMLSPYSEWKKFTTKLMKEVS